MIEANDMEQLLKKNLVKTNMIMLTHFLLPRKEEFRKMFSNNKKKETILTKIRYGNAMLTNTIKGKLSADSSICYETVGNNQFTENICGFSYLKNYYPSISPLYFDLNVYITKLHKLTNAIHQLSHTDIVTISSINEEVVNNLYYIMYDTFIEEM